MVTGRIQRRRRARRRSSNSSRTRPDWPTGSGINTDWLGKVVEAASGVTLDVRTGRGQPARSNSIRSRSTSPADTACTRPRDYVKFQQALLNVGTFDGTEILGKSTVDAAFTNQIGDLVPERRAWSGAWAGLLNTHFWVDRTSGITGAIYTQFLPFVTPEGDEDVQRLREGAVRLAVTRRAGINRRQRCGARPRRCSVEVADEDAVVALVILRPDSWLVQYLCSGLAGSFVYGVDGVPVGAVKATWTSRLSVRSAGPSQNFGSRPGRPSPRRSHRAVRTAWLPGCRGGARR